MKKGTRRVPESLRKWVGLRNKRGCFQNTALAVASNLDQTGGK